MNPSEKLRIHELILKAMDNQISPEEFAQLNHLLMSGPDSRRYYGEVIDEYRTLYECPEIISSLTPAMEPVLQEQLWRSLAENERNADTVVPEPAVLQRELPVEKQVQTLPYRINKFSLYTAIGSIAALIFLLTYVQVAGRFGNQFCGYVSRTIDAGWSSDTAPMAEGSAVYSGSLTLDRGLAEVVMESGARIILQGPMQLKFESPYRLRLDQGNIAVSFQNENADKQFIVRTPSSCVVDFGTEFGVSVTSAGLTETHVRQGVVELRDGTNPSRFKQRLQLLASQAGCSESDGSLKEIHYEKTKFVYKNEFDVRIKAIEGSSYHRWLAYSYELGRDPDLVLYYPFAKSQEQQPFVTNAAAATENTHKGVFGGSFGLSKFTAPTWTAGRWPQKAALRFERDKRTCVAIAESSALNLAGNITLAVWIRCPDAQKGGHILSNRQDEHINYQFGCFAAEDPYYSRRLQLLRKDDSSKSTVYSSRRYDWSSEWTLLAVTHDNKTVCFYIDGVLFESLPFESSRPATPGRLFIGDIPYTGMSFNYAAFNGLMDEIAVLKRAMSADEIQAMYEAGKP